MEKFTDYFSEYVSQAVQLITTIQFQSESLKTPGKSVSSLSKPPFTQHTLLLPSGTLPGNNCYQPKGILKVSLPEGCLPSKDRKQLIRHRVSSIQILTNVAPCVLPPVQNTTPTVSLHIRPSVIMEKSRNQANEQIYKFYEIFKEMSFEISFTDALVLMPKFASTLRTLLGNKEKLTEVARTSNEPCLARTSIINLFGGHLEQVTPRKLGDPGKVPRFLVNFPGLDECLAFTDLVARH
ncbi:hypothetical protein Tco_0149161 [Tanacetum coccineum]